MPFDELLFTAFDKDWYKTIGAIFTSLGEVTSFLWTCSTSIARRCNWDNLIFRSSLNMTDTRVI